MRNQSLDGLRAVAVALVLIQHTLWPETTWTTTPGPFGVRLFFVLSGYLITGILVDARTRAAAGHVWAAFVARRALRIFPLAYLAMATAWFIAAPAMVQHPGSYLTYSANFAMRASSPDFDGLNHFWSLCVEEQFYLLWPLVVLWVPTRRLATVTSCVIGAAVIARAVTVHTLGLWPAYVLPWSRFDALAGGALLAVAPPKYDNLMLGAGCAFMVRLLPGLPAGIGLSAFEFGLVLLSLLVVRVAAAGRVPLLASRPVVWCGAISYGLYVWSGLMPEILRWVGLHAGLSLLPANPGLPRLVMIVLPTFLIAAGSWYGFERRVSDLKRFIPYAPRTDVRRADRGVAYAAAQRSRASALL